MPVIPSSPGKYKKDHHGSGKTAHKVRTYLKNNQCSQARWLIPVIPATREAEIRRIVVQNQHGKIV
jgi:hypothetical protein